MSLADRAIARCVAAVFIAAIGVCSGSLAWAQSEGTPPASTDAASAGDASTDAASAGDASTDAASAGDASTATTPADETWPDGYPADRWLPETDLEGADPVLEDRRRAVPDYDGRPDRRTAGDVAIWIPRVVLYPVHLVTEYVLRRPLVGLVTWLEKHDVIAKAVNVVSFGTRGRVGLIPTAFVDFGVRPSVGLYLWANNVPTNNDRFALHFAWGGERWWRLSVRETVPFTSPLARDEDGDVRVHLLYDARPDHLLWLPTDDGTTPASYFARELGAGTELELPFGTFDTIDLSVDVANLTFADGSTRGIERAETTVGDLARVPDRDLGTLLAGFDGYTALRADLDVSLDTRRPRPEPGSGARVLLFGGGVQALDGSFTGARWGGEGSVHLDVDGRHRVLSLRQRVEGMQQVGSGDIPIHELPTLGGADAMRGFVSGRFRGPATTVTSIQYTYPVWSMADGFVFYEVGGAFEDRFDDFELGRLAGSFGLGLRTINDRDAAFNVIVGAGTEAFDDGGRVEDLRLVFGVSRGF